MGKRRAFGQITKMRSGRFQARYTGPDRRLHTAPSTFEDRETAQLWLRNERILTESPESWEPPAVRLAKATNRLTFGKYADAWLASRKVKGRSLAERTRDHYRQILDDHILPTFADVPLTSITTGQIDEWYELTAIGRPTAQAHAYSLLRTILGTAVDRGVIKTANPAKVRGGGWTKRVKKVEIATLDELETIASAMPEERRLMVLLAAWCALRYGELAELRRRDVDTRNAVLRIRRGVVRTSTAGTIVKAPKSEAGVRDVAIPPHLMPMVRSHLLEHTAPGRDGLLFPGVNGEHLAPSTFYGRPAALRKDGSVKSAGWGYYEARRQAGREDLRFHDLRHLGAVLAARTGATLADLMGRLGHSTPGAAMRYQHTAAERDKDIARKLSEMAGGVE